MPNVCQREVEWSDFYLGNAAGKAGSKVGAARCRRRAVDWGSKQGGTLNPSEWPEFGMHGLITGLGSDASCSNPRLAAYLLCDLGQTLHFSGLCLGQSLGHIKC